MNSVSAQNLEDAANIATEFIYSIENVPNEVKHLLEEILHKETKSQQLQQQIDTDTARWMKHSLRGSTPTSSLSASPSPSPSSSNKSVNHLPARIKQNYAEIDQIAAEKIALSQKMIELISRTTARLEVDLNKVRQLQGDIPDYTKSGGLSALPSLSNVDMLRSSTGGGAGGLGGRDPASSISESLRMALSNSAGAVGSPGSETTRKAAAAANALLDGGGSGTATPSTKRRRTAASPSIKLPPTKSRSISPAASGAATTKGSHSRSRLSRQIHPPPRQQEILDDVEDEVEAEEEVEGEEDEDADDRLYCFCQKTSYGDMIACDNEGGCPYEWFHLSCVGLNRPVPDTWYCSVCQAKMGTSNSSSRKGRKK